MTGIDGHLASADAATEPTDVISKALVQAVSTANVAALSGLPTVDGHVFASGERLLLTGQQTGAPNGIWNVAVGVWTRPDDFASGHN